VGKNGLGKKKWMKMENLEQEVGANAKFTQNIFTHLQQK